MTKKQQPRSGSKTRYTGFVVASIDGRISFPDKVTADWASREDQHFFQIALARADAVVVGRNTFEISAVRLRKRNTFVFSSRLKTIRRDGMVTFVNPTNVDIKELFRGYKNVAVVGGSGVYQTMLDNGFLDEMYVTIEPLIFGRGKEMFVGGSRMTKLSLVSLRKLNRSGTLLLRYKISQ